MLRGSTKPFSYSGGGAIFLSEIKSDGMVELAVHSKGASVSGREIFGQMMTHYGKEVKGIRGNFIEDNLATINELTAQGMSLERAINYTWTAKMAWEHGFKNVTLLKDSVRGTPGHYTRVMAEYR